jgi:hypothetical protein
LTDTLVVNLYGGPGTGKSTTAAGLFALLKERGRNVELAPEFAKDLVWEGRNRVLENQLYILGKQMHRVWRLLGQVDAVITDSPILLALFYAPEWTELHKLALDVWSKWNTLDIFITRDPERGYNPKGRTQTEEEAREVDVGIAYALDAVGVPFTTYPKGPLLVPTLADLVEMTIG